MMDISAILTYVVSATMQQPSRYRACRVIVVLAELLGGVVDGVCHHFIAKATIIFDG